MTTPFEPTDPISENLRYKKLSRADAKWQNIADVDWDDLTFYIDRSRRVKDKDSFDTAIRVLETLKKQVLERK